MTQIYSNSKKEIIPNILTNFLNNFLLFCLKFMFSQKATKIEEIFTVDLTLCSKCQIDGEDFVNFCGLLRKYELYECSNRIS